jgi:endonuclease/exonuclease/phosphatase family metal-dependent hydrolase
MTFKLLSYNIRDGGQGRLNLIAEVIQSQQPQAVALLEANSKPNAKALADTLGMHFAYGPANSEFAIAWLSHLPIKRSHNHRLAVLAKTLLEVEVDWDGAPLSLFATHLIAGRTATAAHQRAVEVEAILDTMRLVGSRPHLLVGDFNAIHPDDPIGQPPPGEKQAYIARHPIELILEAGYLDCYRRQHPDVSGYTYTAAHPWLRLDYIFASSSIGSRVGQSDVVTGRKAEQASDHLPVWAELV